MSLVMFRYFLIISLLFIFPEESYSYVDISKQCLNNIRGPIKLSEEELYEIVNKDENVSKEDFTNALNNMKGHLVWSSVQEEKLYYLAKGARYVFVVSPEGYSDYVWSNGLLSEVLRFRSVMVGWRVVEVLKQPLVNDKVVESGNYVDIFISSGYLFNEKLGEGGYELGLDAQKYFFKFEEQLSKVGKLYEEGELTLDERTSKRDELLEAHKKSIYANVDFFNRGLDIESLLQEKSLLCDISSVRSGEDYIVFLDRKRDGVYYRVMGVSVFPEEMRPQIEKAIKGIKENE